MPSNPLRFTLTCFDPRHFMFSRLCTPAYSIPGGFRNPLLERYRAGHRRPWRSASLINEENWGVFFVDRFVLGPWRMDREVSEQDKAGFREAYAKRQPDGLYAELRRLHGDDAGVDGWFVEGWEIEQVSQVGQRGLVKKARPLLHVRRQSEDRISLEGPWQDGKTAAEEQLDEMRRSFRRIVSNVLSGRAPMLQPGAVGVRASSSSSRSSPY